MTGRIEACFARLKREGKKALVTFVMGGDADIVVSESLLGGLPGAGADLIEIGMPFSDPMADGPTIQAAGLRALKSGTKLKDILSMVTRFRKAHPDTPIILMGYYNPVYRFGVEAFCKQAVKAGADGIILVDLPPEEEEEFTSVAAPHGFNLIRLIAPTTDDARLQKLARSAGGFLYYIAVAGVTGTKSADLDTLRERVGHITAQVNLPVAVGFGIRTPAQAADIAAFSDAVVIGSALVEIAHTQSQSAALDFIRSVRAALDAR